MSTDEHCTHLLDLRRLRGQSQEDGSSLVLCLEVVERRGYRVVEEQKRHTLELGGTGSVRDDALVCDGRVRAYP